MEGICIKKINIKNFRSIRNETIYANDINVFVGLNDVGKSNFLKALNLFFNNETDYGVKFDFSRDFSYLFPKTSHGTREIKIEITFLIPDSYKDFGEYVWTKKWRINNYYSSEILKSDKSKPSKKSRIPGSLNAIKFRYVPAVKSREYFKSLLSELYNTTSKVMNSPLQGSIQTFTQVIQDYTKSIDEEVSTRIGINSRLSVPDNLSEMFKSFTFATNNSDESENTIPLELRGDGIQARHIPIVLKYIADEDQKTRNSGASKIISIWGFEEPENGVELTKAYEMANDFFEYSKDIQMFITSHSPAFYTLKKDKKTRIFYVSQEKNENGKKIDGTKISANYRHSFLTQEMGLMPLIAPYITEKDNEIRELKKLVEGNFLLDLPKIVVEGKTDKQYLELAIGLFDDELYQMLKRRKLEIFYREGEGGCKNIEYLVYSWIYSGNKNKLFALFDADIAGKKIRKSIIDNNIYKESKKNNIKLQILSPNQNIKTIFKSGLNYDFEIENLFSIPCLEELIKKGYFQKKDSKNLFDLISEKDLSIDQSVLQILSEKINDKNLFDTLILMEPKDNKKEKIFKYINSLDKETQKEYLKDLEEIVKDLKKYFIKGEEKIK